MAPSGKGIGAGDRLRIVVLGYVVRGPLGGMVWSNLQYLKGLARLGHEVYFVEDSGDHPSCYDPGRDVVGADPTYGLAFAARAFEEIGLDGRWAYWDARASRWLGPCADGIDEVCATADLLLNLCGVNPLRPWLQEIPVRAIIDEDPAFTQIRHLSDRGARHLASQHTAFFSFAENIGRSRCAIPDDGFPWRPTRQPVVLEDLLATPGPAHGKFTTVMLWTSYPAREYAGVRYGMKAESFGPFMDLPEKAGRIFELAVGSPSAPRALLRRKGWALRDPREPTRDVQSYRRYIRRSKAEFSVAKHGYVISRSGWFSERSAAYLASGRPVLIQDTGFSDGLETGHGIVPFSTPEEALAGIEEINRRYTHHCRAAREIVEAHFDARRVLSRLIECAMHPASAPTIDPAEGPSPSDSAAR